MKFINRSLSASGDWRSDSRMDYLPWKSGQNTSYFCILPAFGWWLGSVYPSECVTSYGSKLRVFRPPKPLNQLLPACWSGFGWGSAHVCCDWRPSARLSREREGPPVRPMRPHCFPATMQPSAAMLETSAHSQG